MAYISKRKALRALRTVWLWTNRWPVISGIVVIIIALYILPLPPGDVKDNREVMENRTTGSKGAAPASAELIRNDFEYWLWSFDDTLAKELESMKMDWRQRGVFNSGMAVTETIRFYEAKRMERDHVIDSFLISYSMQDGDTTQLKYSRKLPGNVGAGLIRWANSMDLDIRRYCVDTL